MKTALISLFIATLLGLAFYAGVFSFGAEQIVSALFATGFATWTIALYSRDLRPVMVARPIHLPIKMSHENLATQSRRLAA